MGVGSQSRCTVHNSPTIRWQPLPEPITQQHSRLDVPLWGLVAFSRIFVRTLGHGPSEIHLTNMCSKPATTVSEGGLVHTESIYRLKFSLLLASQPFPAALHNVLTPAVAQIKISRINVLHIHRIVFSTVTTVSWDSLDKKSDGSFADLLLARSPSRSALYKDWC